jgi:hypothetical protein
MSDSFAGIEQHVNELAGVQKNNSNISPDSFVKYYKKI